MRGGARGLFDMRQAPFARACCHVRAETASAPLLRCVGARACTRARRTVRRDSQVGDATAPHSHGSMLALSRPSSRRHARAVLARGGRPRAPREGARRSRAKHGDGSGAAARARWTWHRRRAIPRHGASAHHARALVGCCRAIARRCERVPHLPWAPARRDGLPLRRRVGVGGAPCRFVGVGVSCCCCGIYSGVGRAFGGVSGVWEGYCVAERGTGEGGQTGRWR